MANEYIKLSAEECDAILSAREELASHFSFGGRISQGYDALTQSKLINGVPHNYRDRVVETTLAEWDRFNESIAARRLAKLPNAYDAYPVR